MLRKMNELDRSLGTLLAVIPHNDRGGEALTWIDGRDPNNRDPAVVVTNAEIEEKFHQIFGPYVLDGYEYELRDMLTDSIRCKRGTHHYTCSTVKLDYHRMNNVLFTIHQIFIRPCLQRHKVFGKIILFFARNLPRECTFTIDNCQSASSAAIDKHYGGNECSIFERTTREHDGLVTYEVKNRDALIKKLEFLDRIPFPSIAELNGKACLSDLDVRWANLAKLHHDYDFYYGDELFRKQFIYGYNSIDFLYEFWNICSDLKQEIRKILHHTRHDDPDDDDEQMRLKDAIHTIDLLLHEDDFPIPTPFHVSQ